MPLIPDLRINPYVQPYVGNTNREFDQTIDQNIQRFEQNQEFDDVLGYQTDTLLQNVAPFEGDIGYAKQLMNDSRKAIQSRVERGDYENMSREIKRNARDFAGKVQPLLENQKRFSSYLNTMEDLYKTGKISVDTYSKAKQASLGNYKGIDPTNIQGSLFRGFTPSPDINVADKIDKFFTGWKADGGAKIIPDGQGGFTKVSWEAANENELNQAAQEYLMGDEEFKNYAQTQGVINNTDRVNNEVQNGILAGMKKHGFYKGDISQQWEPEWLHNNKKSLELAQQLGSVPSSATLNPNAVNIFEGQGQKFDSLTGKVILSDLVSREGDKLYIFKDDKGNQISASDYNTYESSRRRRQTVGEGVGIEGPSKYTKIEVTPEQAAKTTIEANQQLVNMASERFLQEAIKSGKIKSEQLLNDQQFVNDYLRINQGVFTKPKYLKDTYNYYSEAVKNSQQINDNRRWDIGAIAGGVSPEFTKVQDDDILANLTGQSVGILDTDIGGFRKGQKADLNSMLDKLQDDGYKVNSVRRLGPLKYNPYSNLPAISYAITLEDGDKKVKVMEIAAAVNDPELQPLQNVYNLAYKGMSGNVPFNAPNSPLGNIQGQFRIRTSTDLDSDNKRKFAGFVEILDSNGNKLNIQGFPQNIPLSEFPDVYKQLFAPNVLTKYLNPKYR